MEKLATRIQPYFLQVQLNQKITVKQLSNLTFSNIDATNSKSIHLTQDINNYFRDIIMWINLKLLIQKEIH